jgi:hypothetical protein
MVAREGRLRRSWIALVHMLIVPPLVLAKVAAIRGRIVDPAKNILLRAAVQLFPGNQAFTQTRSTRSTTYARFLLTLHATGALTLKLANPVSEVVGVRTPSCASLNITHRFGRNPVR